MKKISGVIILLFISIGLFAQSNSKALIISTVGKVDYYGKNDRKRMRVLPMQKLDLDGKIKVARKGSVKLLYENNSYKVTDPGSYTIRDIVKPGEVIEDQSFASRFWTFINSGLQSGNDKNALENYHQDYMETSVGGVSGFGEGGKQLGKVVPGPGILSAGTINFQWPQANGVNRPYHFIIQEDETEKVICYLHTRDSFLSIDLDQIDMENGKLYSWGVSFQKPSADDKKEEDLTILIAGKIPFRYQPNPSSFIQPKLTLLEGYKDASDWEKMWMEAIVMEQEGFFYDSEQRYLEMLDTDPEDLFIKIMYATFLARQDKMDRALKFLE